MARGRPTSLTVCLTPAERHLLLARQRAITTPAGLAGVSGGEMQNTSNSSGEKRLGNFAILSVG